MGGEWPRWGGQAHVWGEWPMWGGEAHVGGEWPRWGGQAHDTRAQEHGAQKPPACPLPFNVISFCFIYKGNGYISIANLTFSLEPLVRCRLVSEPSFDISRSSLRKGMWFKPSD